MDCVMWQLCVEMLGLAGWWLVVGCWGSEVGRGRLAVKGGMYEAGGEMLKVGAWKLDVEGWTLEVGSGRLEVGGWRLEVERRRLEVGCGMWMV